MTSYSPDPTEGGFYYYLYECDQFDIFCTELYSASQFSVSEVVGNIAPGSEELVSDLTTNTVTLEINGQIVCTYTPT